MCSDQMRGTAWAFLLCFFADTQSSVLKKRYRVSFPTHVVRLSSAVYYARMPVACDIDKKDCADLTTHTSL